MATLYYESSFAHHGIKGQKWGVRRFQNYDGTLIKSGQSNKVAPSGHRKVTVNETTEHMKEAASTVAAIGLTAVSYVSMNIAPVETSLIVLPVATALATAGAINGAKVKHREKADFFKKEGPVEKATDLKRYKPPEELDKSYKSVNSGRPSLGSGREVNCAACSMAIDLRQKGYDVRARKMNDGLSTSQITSVYKGSKSNKIEIAKGSTYQKTYDTICDSIAKENKGNSSGVFLMGWAGGGGHAIYYKSQNGNVEFYDGQNGKMGKSLDKYLVHMDPETLEYVRTDNCNPTDPIGEYVISKKEKER